MNTTSAIRIRRRWHAFVAAFLVAAAAAASDEPSRRAPTPRPGTLADYARRVSLNAPEGAVGPGPLTISSANLGQLAVHGRLIRGAVEAPRAAAGPGSPVGDRDLWRGRYFEQRRVLIDLEGKRARLAAEIDRLESGRLTAAIMARIDRAEVELRLLEREVQDAKTELGRLVRDARRHGAEPGWFR